MLKTFTESHFNVSLRHGHRWRQRPLIPSHHAPASLSVSGLCAETSFWINGRMDAPAGPAREEGLVGHAGPVLRCADVTEQRGTFLT